MWMAVLFLLAVIGAVSLVARRDGRVEQAVGGEGRLDHDGDAARSVSAGVRSREATVALLGIAMLAGAAVLVAAARYFSDDLRCPVDGEESNYGNAEWSWFPIGTTCRWTEVQNGFDRVAEPGWWPTLLIAVMVGAGLSAVLASITSSRRRSGSPRREGAHRG